MRYVDEEGSKVDQKEGKTVVDCDCKGMMENVLESAISSSSKKIC